MNKKVILLLIIACILSVIAFEAFAGPAGGYRGCGISCTAKTVTSATGSNQLFAVTSTGQLSTAALIVNATCGNSTNTTCFTLNSSNWNVCGNNNSHACTPRVTGYNLTTYTNASNNVTMVSVKTGSLNKIWLFNDKQLAIELDNGARKTYNLPSSLVVTSTALAQVSTGSFIGAVAGVAPATGKPAICFVHVSDNPGEVDAEECAEATDAGGLMNGQMDQNLVTTTIFNTETGETIVGGNLVDGLGNKRMVVSRTRFNPTTGLFEPIEVVVVWGGVGGFSQTYAGKFIQFRPDRTKNKNKNGLVFVGSTTTPLSGGFYEGFAAVIPDGLDSLDSSKTVTFTSTPGTGNFMVSDVALTYDVDGKANLLVTAKDSLNRAAVARVSVGDNGIPSVKPNGNIINPLPQIFGPTAISSGDGAYILTYPPATVDMVKTDLYGLIKKIDVLSDVSVDTVKLETIHPTVIEGSAVFAVPAINGSTVIVAMGNSIISAFDVNYTVTSGDKIAGIDNGGHAGDYLQFVLGGISLDNHTVVLDFFNTSLGLSAVNPNGTTRFTTNKQVVIQTMHPDINILNFQLDFQAFNGTFDTSAGDCTNCSFDLDNTTCQAEVEKIWGMFQQYNLTMTLSTASAINLSNLTMYCRDANKTVAAHPNCAGLFSTYGVGTTGCMSWVATPGRSWLLPLGAGVGINLAGFTSANLTLGTMTPTATCEQIACEIYGTWRPGNTQEFTMNKTITVTAI